MVRAGLAQRKRGAGSGYETLVDGDWSRGMIRDTPRTAIPQGGVYDAADFLLHQPAFAQKRGGTAYAGPAMTAATYAAAVAYAEFPAGSKLLGIGDNGHLYTITSGSTTDISTLGATYVPVDTPKLRIGGAKNLLILPGSDGLTPAKTYDGSAVAILGSNTTLNAAVPPTVLPTGTITVASTTGFPTSGTIWIQDQAVAYTGVGATTFTGCTGGTGSFANGVVVSNAPPVKFLTIYKSRAVFAGAKQNPNRIYFSPTPDITTAWDTANSWIDADYPISGLASFRNTLLIFSQGRFERILGDTPPPGSNMDRAPVAAIGCTDARSIVVTEEGVIFANPNGIYITAGGIPESLTGQGLAESYWQSLFSSYDPSTWTIAAGRYWRFYVVSVLDNNGALKATLLCYLPRRAWMRATNIRARMFAQAVGVANELYYADRATNRVTGLSGIFAPAAGNKNDADGTAVAPMLETRLLGTGAELKQFGFGRLSYDMRDAATDNPTLAITVAPGVEAPTFTAVAESPLAETTDETRARVTVAKKSQGVTVRLQQTNASSKTELYALEYEQRAFPPGQLGQ